MPKVDNRDTHSITKDGSKGAKKPSPSALGSGAAARAASAAKKRNERQNTRLSEIMGQINSGRTRKKQ